MNINRERTQTVRAVEILPPAAHYVSDDAIGGEPIFTPAEVALWLATSTTVLRRWRDSEEGPAFIDLGQGDVRYCLSDLREWLRVTRKLKALPASAKPQRGLVYGSRGPAAHAA